MWHCLGQARRHRWYLFDRCSLTGSFGCSGHTSCCYCLELQGCCGKSDPAEQRHPCFEPRVHGVPVSYNRLSVTGLTAIFDCTIPGESVRFARPHGTGGTACLALRSIWKLTLSGNLLRRRIRLCTWPSARPTSSFSPFLTDHRLSLSADRPLFQVRFKDQRQAHDVVLNLDELEDFYAGLGQLVEYIKTERDRRGRSL